MSANNNFLLPFDLPVTVATKIHFRVHPNGFLLPKEVLLLLSYEVKNEPYVSLDGIKLPTLRIKAVTPSGELLTIKKEYDDFVRAVRQGDVWPITSATIRVD